MADGVQMITTSDQYNKVSQDTQSLLAEPLLRADRGGELSDDDKARLSKGIPIFESLGDFAPTEMTPFFVLSKLYLNLGKPEQAEESARQAIYNGDAQLTAAKNAKDDKKEAEIAALMNEAHHVRAQALFELKDYKESIREVKGVLLSIDPKNVNQDPNVPRYLVTLARDLIQLNDNANAKAALQDALKRDPGNTQAQSLLKFLNGV
ncbi:hypothetical protein BH11ARM2_BH11ARM2_11640 [soil metagenome]